MLAMEFRFRKFMPSSTAATLSTMPLVPQRQRRWSKARGSRPVLAIASAIWMALNNVALIADAVASSAPTDTAMKPAWPSTGRAAWATAVSAWAESSAGETLCRTTTARPTYSKATTPIAR